MQAKSHRATKHPGTPRTLIFGLLWALPLLADSKNQVFADFSTPLPLPRGSTLVLGIVGGWERWDAEQRIIRRIALQVRERQLPGVWVETVENHKMELAEELVRKAFPDPAAADLLMFGQSLGGAAAVRFARRLQELGYPVRRLVIIDSIGRGGRMVPANVAAAVNLYQRDSFWPVRGRKRIIAEDPARTRILGNHRFRYHGRKITMPDETWLRRTFLRGHLRMEYDPEVWSFVERNLLF